MLLNKIKQKIYLSLSGKYPENELNQFFYILVEHFLGLTKIDIIKNPDIILSSDELNKFYIAISRLQNNEPVQYITGYTEFFGRKFLVTPDVLIPRPETEELVNWIITDYFSVQKKIKIIDIGTGSGCIAISLASELSDTNIIAVDNKETILFIANKNAENNQCNIIFEKIDIFCENEVKALTKYKIDILVSNPPYVLETDKKKMHNNILDFEPEQALFVPDNNPLIYYSKIIEIAKNILIDKGAIFFEIHEEMANRLSNLLIKNKFSNIIIKKDIHKKDRMIKANYEA